jgi:hypothetical protein
MTGAAARGLRTASSDLQVSGSPGVTVDDGTLEILFDGAFGHPV